MRRTRGWTVGATALVAGLALGYSGGAAAEPAKPGGQGDAHPVTAAKTSRSALRAAPAAAPTGFDGLAKGTAGGGHPPDATAALGTDQFVETAGRRIEVYGRDGSDQCGWSMAEFTGGTGGLTAPRVQYDPVAHRFALVVAAGQGAAGSAPAVYFAVSRSGDACGDWHVYRLAFTGSYFPAGGRVDFPHLGQDARSVIVTTDNYTRAGRYHASTVFALPKATMYGAGHLDFTAFPVSFSTAPAQVQGSAATTYLLSAVPGKGYDLYALTGTGTAASVVRTGRIAATVTAPTRRAAQPGTKATLEVLDARIASAPVQRGDRLWFAHTVGDSRSASGGRADSTSTVGDSRSASGGRADSTSTVGKPGGPTVRYGAVQLGAQPTVTTATMARSATSDDLNPSIGVTSTGRPVVSWAFTDPKQGQGVSVAVDTLPAGAPLTNRVGTATTLVTGGHTTSDAAFGRYSSVVSDPTAAACSVGVAQEYIASSGNWRTRLAVLTYC